MYSLSFKEHTAIFREPGGTSRGILYEKPSWILKLQHPDYTLAGYGEISIIPGLSVESKSEVESFLTKNKSFNEATLNNLLNSTSPAIRFALEMAKKSLDCQAVEMFGEAIDLNIESNGLVWMGDIETMKRRTLEKIEEGFTTLKFKIGANDFNDELNFLKWFREQFPNKITIRLDANGAFTPENALEKLKALADYSIHSIEQPIKANQWDAMAKLCIESPIAIALDEELIGIKTLEEKAEILSKIKPQYIILKNALIGGWVQADEWIALCKKHNIGWWATSSLELNIGLNAIAYHLSKYNNPLPQGLGTGKVFTNNIDSNIKLDGRFLKKEKNSRDLLYSNCKTLSL